MNNSSNLITSATDGNTPLSTQLTTQEIESLRQDKKESHARGKVLWAEIRAKKEAARKK